MAPATVELLDSGSDGELRYLVFERVDGVDLSDVLRERGMLPVADAIHILRQLLDSLGEAHQAGLVHRDLKPENVRVFSRDRRLGHLQPRSDGV